MNIVIGVRGSARELALELDLDREELARRLDSAIAEQSVLDLVDVKGQRFLVPARSIGYVQMTEQVERRVGFAIG